MHLPHAKRPPRITAAAAIDAPCGADQFTWRITRGWDTYAARFIIHQLTTQSACETKTWWRMTPWARE